MRYQLDSTWQRFGPALIAGSPLRLFRTTPSGEAVLRRLEDGESIDTNSLIDRLLDAGAIHPSSGDLPSTFGIDDVTIVTPQLRSGPRDRAHSDGRITIDDGSVPPLADATRRLALNRGPATARNAARPLVSTPLVAFVDGDVETGADREAWLRPLIAHFDDPRVGLVAPRVVGERDSPLDLGDQPARIRAGTRVSYVPAATLVVRVAALDSIGGFDPTLRFGEDVDLVWRLDDAGWRCRYEPSSTVSHPPRSGFRARLHQHADYGTSAAPLSMRHPGALAPARCNGWTALVWIAAVSGHLVTAMAIASSSAAALGPKLPDIDDGASFRLAVRGHLAAGGQFARAVRRTWWPLVLVASLVSRRARWIAVGSIVVDWRVAPTDVAYGWGVWVGMLRHRTLAPLLPTISAWPQRDRRSARRHPPRAEPRRAPRAGGR